MTAFIATLALGLQGAGAAPGPLDGFLANFASIRVDTEFVVEQGLADRRSLTPGSIWGGAPVAIAEERLRRVRGRWECDGTAEHLVYWPVESQDDAPQYGLISAAISPAEVIADNEVFAFHILSEPDEGTLRVMVETQTAMLRYGPFAWLWGTPFPRSLEQQFPGVEPTYTTATRGGYFTEVAIYKRETPNGRVRGEFSYDPSVGYLPRYVRIISSDDGGKTFVKEMYLVEARPCAAGGFVPIEWYELTFDFDDFAGRYPDYDHDTELRSPQSRVPVIHFRTTAFADRSAPVALDRLENVEAISGVGGEVRLRRPRATLTLAEVKNTLGWKRLHEPLPMPSMNVDLAEVHRFETPPRRSWTRYWIGGGVLLAVAVPAAWAWRHARALVLLVAVVGGSGCQHEPAGPVVRLSGAFAEPRFVYTPGPSWLERTLVLANEGNQPVRIFDVDGGCSCRRVDRSEFPVVLEPGDRVELPIRLQDKKDDGPQAVAFTCETDRGNVRVLTTLQAVPSLRMIPASVSIPDLDEDDDVSFDLVLRRVIPAGGGEAAYRLHLPPGSEAEATGTRSGRVTGLEGVTFEDTTYHVTLSDDSLGLHKDSVRLTGADGAPLGEVPVVWRRVPFLSSVPDRVTLGNRSVRVFLRCPDDRVELTRVLSIPEGIEAVVSSPRELTVLLADGAPGIIDGAIEVGTSADGRPPLRVPVVRYAPPAGQGPPPSMSAARSRPGDAAEATRAQAQGL